MLYVCARDFGDGTALRLLFEFSDSINENVRINLNRSLTDLGDGALGLLTRTRVQQISALLVDNPANASNRLLWTLKTFLDDDRVVAFLSEASNHGRIFALLSLLCQDARIDWFHFDNIRLTDFDEAQRFVNAMLENISRGADSSYGANAEVFRDWPLLRAEFSDGLAAIDDCDR